MQVMASNEIPWRRALYCGYFQEIQAIVGKSKIGKRKGSIMSDQAASSGPNGGQSVEPKQVPKRVLHTGAEIPAIGKWVLCFLMLLGRLEIYTVIIMFSPSFWKK